MTEEELAAMTRGLLSCDEGAWRAFHESHFQTLHGLVISRGVPACDAPEIVQGVYLRVLRHAKAFQDQGSFHAWLACLVRCEVIDARRKKGRRHWLNERFQHWQEARRSAEPPAVHEGLEEALLSLDEPDRDLIRSHYLDGWSQETLAARHQVNVKAIESKLARLRKRLRETLSHPATPSS